MTSSIPGLVIFLNNQINSTELTTFQTQLFINQTMSLADFNTAILNDGYYVSKIHGSHTRILVLLDDFTDQTNRQFADLILYVVRSGMVSVLDNITGCPKGEMDFNSMTVYDLLKLKNPQPILIVSVFVIIVALIIIVVLSIITPALVIVKGY